MSRRCWREAETIFSIYRDGSIKGQKRVKELGMPDCKKCNRQFLHGLTKKLQFTLLGEISVEKITFSEANTKAVCLKKEEVASITYCYM